MRFRSRVPRRKGRRDFRRTAMATNKRNRIGKLMRGGYRL